MKAFQAAIEDFRRQRPIRAGSLIVTVFCDTVSQHGNSIWLGSLIQALAPFGLSQRLVRTSVYRLVQDQWLCTRQVGRRSYYSLTDTGIRHYEKAAKRIYAATPESWDGHWTLVLPVALFDRDRDILRRELQWLGYGTLAPGIMAHPNAERKSLDQTLAELQMSERVIVLNASTEDVLSTETLRSLTYSSWKLSELAHRYDGFLSTFRPVLKAARQAKTLPPERSFQVRTLLIHEYRRLLLRDADLPDELLPSDWPGRAAGQLTANLYRHIQHAAEMHIDATMESAEGPVPPAAPGYFHRFGRLPTHA